MSAPQSSFPPTPTLHIRTARRRLSSALGWTSFLCYVLSTGLTPALIIYSKARPWEDVAGTLVIFAYLVSYFVCLVSLAGWLLTRHVRRSSGTFEVREGALRLADERGVRTLARGTIAAGYVVPAGEGESAAQVEFVGRGGTRVTFEVGGVGIAEQVLEALGLDPSQRRAEIALPAPPGTWLRGLGVYMLVTMASLFLPLLVAGRTAGDTPLPMLTSALGLLLAVLVARRYAPVFVIGTDGLRVRRGLVRERYFPYESIESVEPIGHLALEIGVSGAPPLRVTVPAKGSDALKAVAYRIEEARRPASTAEEGRGALVEQLDRRGRSLESWRAAIEALVRSGGGYREAAVERDELLKTLCDPNEPPERRVGAGLALQRLRDPEAPGELRRAAESSASDALRTVFTKLAEGTLAERDLKALLDER
jgi:hypothetical protein